MHFHHRHDVEGCLDAHHDWPERDRVMLATLDRMESRMSTLQQQIDDLAVDVRAATEAIAAKAIDTPDLSGLTAAVADLKAATAPADPAPVELPAAPVADTPAAPVEQPAAPAAETGLGDATVIA